MASKKILLGYLFPKTVSVKNQLQDSINCCNNKFQCILQIFYNFACLFRLVLINKSVAGLFYFRSIDIFHEA